MSNGVPMWRSVRKEAYPNGTVIEGKAVEGVLYPDFEEKLITSGPQKGRMRAADVETIAGFVQPGKGTSLFDKEDVFGTKYWCCFPIPKGTVIPEPLIIAGPEYNAKYDANHYQIETRIPLRLDVFKAMLNQLARNAVVRACELAK